MKSLLAKVVAPAIVLGTLASCSSLDSPSVLSKNDARSIASSSKTPKTADISLKNAASSLPKDKHGRPTYTSDRIRQRFVRTTAYSCAENEVGAYGNLNAAGTVLKYGKVRSAAADWSRYPVGTTFKIKGLPYTYVVDDYGSALVGTNTIDIYHPNLSLMRQWGTRDVEINVIHWGSWERTLNLLRKRTKYDHCARMYYASLAKLRREGRYAAN